MFTNLGKRRTSTTHVAEQHAHRATARRQLAFMRRLVESRDGLVGISVAVSAACRRLLLTVARVPHGAGRSSPPLSVGRRRPLIDKAAAGDFARRSSAAARNAAVSFKANARRAFDTLGDARPEDGLRRARGAFHGPGGRRRRKGVALAGATVVVVLASGMGLTGAMAAVTDPPFVVDNTTDKIDANVNGTCAAAVTVADKCTLRAAIQEANARPGADVIYVLPGTYKLEIPPINENAANVGDFEILDPVTIEKAPGYLGNVIIDGGDPLPSSPIVARGIDRLFEIHPGAGDVTFKDVTLRNGYSPEEGGAIQNWSLGKLTLDGVTVKDSYAEKVGGGLNQADVKDYPWTTEPPNLELMPFGRVEIKRSTFTGNGASESGAAINNVSGATITISDGTVVTLNPGPIMPDPLDPEEFLLVDPSDYPLGPSAISNEARWNAVGTIKISGSTVSLNASGTPGAGIASWGDSIVTIEKDSKLIGNRTSSEGGGLFTEGGKVVVSDSEVSKNQAANGGGLYGGGHPSMYGLRSRFDVTNARIFENKAENGGGLYNGGEGQLFVTDTTFTKNLSTDHGAAITSEDRTNMTLTRVSVAENESNGEGGGVWTHSERLQSIVDSSFTRNKAGVPIIEDNGLLSEDVAGGGGLYTNGGPLIVKHTTFDANEATQEGGGASIHNLGDVDFSDSLFKNNRAYDGGGIENSAEEVVFERVTVQSNRAGNRGGGIYNSASGPFTIIDSTIRDNSGVIGGGLANAPDNNLIVRGSLFLNNSARIARNDEGIIEEEAGHGAGLMSFADGESLIENTTFSGNKAAAAGGGIFHDADGELRLVHITVWRNSAPFGGGIGVRESDFVPTIPPAANSAVILKNSIVGGSVAGGNCDWYVRSEGGNLETGNKHTCFLAVTADTAESPIELGVRDRLGDPDLWAIADNGGPTMTHALQYGSFAIDSSEKPCNIVDQRGESRPQNGKCDAGAYEFVGPPPAPDSMPPETYFTPGVDGPKQNSYETMEFKFRGEDRLDPNNPNGGLTPPHELNFECRFFEIDPTEQEEPVEPWLPQPPEFRWNGCSSPWETILFEEGWSHFEVRAIDEAGNIDPTPVKYILSADDMLPPDTVILEGPGLAPGQTVPPKPSTIPTTNSRSALFTFEGVSDFTPPQWFEYECRMDSNDPELWLECFNPAMYSNLATGLHTFEVRAATEVGGFEGDPTPAKYTWRVGPDPNAPTGSQVPLTCDEANVTLTASADGWADQVTPIEAYMFHTELEVRSAANDPGNGQPIVPMNARAFYRFPLANDAPGCELVSATLRLFSEGNTEDRTLEAVPLAETWKESTLTWISQPDPYPGVAPATTPSGELYREWNVKDHVNAIFAGDLPNHGWVIRDQHESDAEEGGDHSFVSREMPQVPPFEVTLPELELRFAPADPPAPPARDDTFVDRNDIACGERITESTRLTADVTGCEGEGISFGAPNIILDLNGHKIESGLILELGQETGGFAGIRVNKPNVEVRGPGVVTNFAYGVLVGPGSIGSLVENVTLYRNGIAGLQIFDADDGRTGNVVRGNRFDSNIETGIQLISNAEGNTVEDNTFTQNAMSIHVYGSHRNVIRGNEVSGIILDPTLDSDAGIVVEGGSRDNVLEDNTVSDTGDAGVKIHEGSHGTQVIGGLYVRNGDAGVIAELSDRIVIDGIASHQQSDGGVVLGDSSGSMVKNSDLRYNPSGIQASNTNGLIVDGNDASESLGAGIELGSGIGMQITNNVANLSGGSGIELEGGAFDANGVAHGGALIADNVTNENAEDGISLEVARHTIARNTANSNAGYGIQAGGEPSPGEPVDPNANIDGGGNRAIGNHAQLEIAPGPAGLVQCLGVVCDESGVPGITGPDLTPPDTFMDDGPLGPVPSPTASTGNETAVFEFHGVDNRTASAAMIFECRLDAPPDPVEIEDPELEPPDPLDPELPEPPEGLNWVECVSPYTLLSLEPGKHIFEVRAHDFAGNFDLNPVKYEWTIHAGVDEAGRIEVPPVAPETRITAAPGELITDEAGTRYDTTNRVATFRFTGSDNLTAGYNLVYECRRYYAELNDELTPADIPLETELPFESCSSPKLYTGVEGDGLEYGGHIFEVRSVDLAGNKDITPAWHAWWIHPPPPDITPPDTTITSGPDPTTILSSATFEFTGSDNQSLVDALTFECRLDGAMAGGQPLWEVCTSPHTVTVTNQATPVEHVFQVRAVDESGNVDDVNGTTSDELPDGVPAAYVWTVGPAAVPKTVFCGQKITQSIKVNNNLADCLGHGLIVGANGITIDLNGKTIDGKSIGAGIMNNGFDSVTIRNGRLLDFDYGVMLNQGTKLNIVEGIHAEKNQDAGIALGRQTWPEDPLLAPSVPVEGFDSGVDGNILRSNTLVVNNNGAWLMNSAQDNVVRGNLIGSTSGEGVFLDRSVANLVEGNDIQVANKHAVLLEGAVDNVVRENSITTVGSGIYVSATTTGTKGIESTGNRVEGNLLTDTAGSALEIDQSSDTEIVDNVVTLSDSVAIELYLANDNVIRGNEVSGNKGGISLRNSISNLIEDNDASNSDTTGITLSGGSLSNILRHNVSSNNVGGGISIGDETPAGQGTLLDGNITNGNVGMGIQASKPAHIFKDNIAFDNGSWGIQAGDPSNGRANVDAGGNIADGNKGPLDVHLKPQQCYNVRCVGGPGGGDQMTPSTTLLDTPVDPSGESVAVFRFTGADNASPVTFECRFESTLESDWTACASPKTFNNLGNDTYTFEVRARDFSGNVDPTPESYTWAVQLDDLEASIDSTPSKITVETSATFTFSANLEAGITFQCALRRVDSPDAVDWNSAQTCTSPKTYTGLEPGVHEFWVRASDAASNYSSSVYSWTIGPAPVEAEVNCGQILEQSTKLTNDLVDCGGYGLIVGAPGITIDLDGHIVDGMGMDAGILNNGHDDVTITNGMVSQFLIGVQLNPGTARNVVHSMRVEGNAEAGIALSDADQAGEGNLIRDNQITANVGGIALYANTRHAVIRNNTLAANLGLGGIIVEFASENLIEGNQIGQTGASGIYMIGGGKNVVRENVIKDSGAFGINAGEELLMSNDNLIERNIMDGGGGGMIVAGARNTVLANSVKNTTGPGVLVEMATDTLVKGNDFSGAQSGISVGESIRTTVEANNASGTLGSGIAIEEMSTDTIVRNNTASGNKGDGIEVTESSMLSELSLIEGNTADGNGGEGISIEGGGHRVKNNVAQMNGGWGIYSIGGIDGGGNFAAGNMEEAQCFGIVCTIGIVPGAPDTWIVDKPADVDTGTPGIQTNSRNVSVTYMGADEYTPIEELVFECRIDSTSMAENAWQDCEYPAELLNLSPGQHTLDIRAIDMLGQGLADPTPASVTWTYVPLPSGVPPEITFDIVPPKETYLFDAIFTFHANEPDVTFMCKVDQFEWQPCGFEGAGFMHQGGFEWGFADEETGPHTFYVRAIDFEGNIGEASYTWTLNGIMVFITDGPGFIPPVGGPLGDPAEGGPSTSSSAEITFEAVPDPGDVTFMCRFDSLDPNGFFPCTSPFRVGPAFAGLPGTHDPAPLLIGDHMLEVYGESEIMGSMVEIEAAEYEWEVVESLNTAPPETTIERAPGAADPSSTVFEFIGVDDLTPDFLLTYECQVTIGTDPPNPSAWEQCFTPFNLLDIYNYGDPEMSLTEKTFYVRAIDMAEPEIVDPTQPDLEGLPDPTPASHTWTPTADTIDPSATFSTGPADGATVGEEVELYTFFGSDNATPLLRLQFECSAFLTASGIENAVWESCTSPVGGGYDISGLEPGAYTVAVRALDMAGNLGPADTRQVTVADAPVVTFLSGPDGRLDPISGIPDGSSATESAVFTYKANQPGVTFECSLDGADFVGCNTPSGAVADAFVHAAWVVETGTHELAIRATNAQGLAGEEVVYEWLVELAADAAEPNTTITSGPENGTLNTVATFVFTGTDNRTPSANLMFECGLDTNTAWNSCVAPQQFSDLQRGSHTLYVRAKDAAGNFDSTPDSYTWIVAPPPVVTILSGPGVELEESPSKTATFTFSADVSPVTFECWLDGKFNPADPADPSKPAPCNPAGQTYENLGLGEHLFAVRAIDQFGNIGVWEDTEFRVTPSEARITAAPANGTSTTATFRFTSDPLDPDATFYCSLDGRPFSLCIDTPLGGGAYEKTYTNLWPGEHTFQVQTMYSGVDWMGLPFEHDPIPAVHIWTVTDVTAPETEIDFGPPATTLSTSAYFQVSSDDPTATITCTLAGPTGTQDAECEPGVVSELTDLVPGSYTLSAVAMDESGNVDSTPATHSWTVGAPSGPPNTPVGTNVSVALGNVTVTFFDVSAAGTTTAELLGGGPSLPDGYGGASTKIYDISTTAAVGEPVTVCISYDPAAFGGTRSLRLLHFDGELWLDITTMHNPFSTPARICSNVVEGFSLFAIAAASSGMMPETSILSGPDGPLNAEGIPTSTSGSATFEFWADQPNAATQCSVDGLPYVACESPFTVGPLEAGEHEFWVQAVNDFGWIDLTPAIYEWEILGPDTTPPTTMITKGPPEGSSTPNYISWFEFSATDDFTPLLEFEYQCTLDGVDLGGCESPEEIEVLEAGLHTLVVQAIDEAGNVDPVGVTRKWTVVDMTFPDTEMILGPEEETPETTATFEFEGFEELTDLPVFEFECALDQEEFVPCTSPYTITNVAPGAHVMLVRAVDPEGNRDISPDFWEWLVLDGTDTTPPDTFITFHPEAGNSGPDVIFGFASNEQVEIFECAWGAGTPPAEPTTWEDCEAVFELQGLPSGPHWLWVRSTDLLLNVDPTPAGKDLGFGPNDTDPFVWVVNANPETFIDSGPTDPSGEFTAEFTFHSDQPNATFQCAIDGLEFTPCTSPYTAGPFLPEENGGPFQHEFEVQALNEFLDANNELVMDESPAIWEWNVQDTTAPETVFLGVEDATPQLLEPALRFKFRATDDWASVWELEFECSLDNTADAEAPIVEDCSEPWVDDTYMYELVYTDLPAGTYEFRVAAMDIAQNVDQTPAPEPAYQFVIEGEPETTITSVTPEIVDGGETTSRSITFTFDSPNTGTSFLCRLGDENALFEECPGGVAGQATYTDLQYGEHLFEVMAVGTQGTPDLSPAQFTWLVGTDVAPDVAITLAPTSGTESTTATFEFGSTDPTATFICSLDSSPATPCSSPWTYEGLLAGVQNPHTFAVEATTPTLLESVVTNEAIHEWTITDAAAPETTLVAPLPTDPSGNQVDFHFTGSDNGTLAANLLFECLLDNGELNDGQFTPCSSPWHIADLTGGEHTFQVRAIDETLFTDLSSAVYTWDVIAPPLTTITNEAPVGTPVLEGGTSTSATGELSFFDQPGSTYECRLDAVDPVVDPFTLCTSPYPYDLSNGEHVFEVRARTLPLDGQGLIESPAAEYTWTIDAPDTTDPDTVIQLGPANPTTSTSATFLFGGADNLTAPADLTYECSLDGATFADCASGDVIAGLSLGDHTLAVRAIDTAPTPNVDGSPAEYDWTIVAPGANNTPAGTNVNVSVGGATLVFENVQTAGFTSVSTITTGSAPNLPSGYNPEGALFYDVSTTAAFVGNVTVCLPYDSIVDAHILHFEGEWIDVALEAQGGLICGVVSSLSPFAVAHATAAVAPNTTIIQAPADPTIQDRADGAHIRFQFASTIDSLEHPAQFECKLDAAPWSACDTPYEYDALFGTYTLRVRALTDTGVRDATPEVYTWTVLARPVVTITSDLVDGDPSTLDIETESRSAEFTFTSDQPGSTFECRLTDESEAGGQSTSWEACTSPKTYGPLALEEYTLEVQGIKNGHTSFLPAEYEWTVADLTPPVVTITSGPSNGSTVDQKDATFAFTADEPATFECSQDGGLTWSIGCISGFTYTNLDRGQHTFHVRATDLTEQENLSAPVSRTWTVADLTAPTVSLGDKPAASTADTGAQFTFGASDNWPGAIALQCRLDGAAFQTCSSPQSYSGLSDGQHTFQAQAADSAGNSQTASYTWTVVDSTPPGEPELVVTTGSLIFTFTSTDDHTAAQDLDYQCRLDGAAYAACTSPKTYSTAELQAMPGDHTFEVRAIDEASNAGDPASHAFTVVDTTDPNTAITGHPTTGTTNTTATFTFAGSDNGTASASLTFECSLDSGAYTGCTSPKEYTGLAVGPHTFDVRATDAAGNVDDTSASHSWTIEAPPAPVDTTDPETSITANPPATTTETNASFSFGGTDDVTAEVTFECSLDTGSYAACTTPKSYTALAVGQHTFRVRAIDAAGNIDESPATFTWAVQSAAVDCGAPQTLTANADSWIDSGSTSSNKGSDSTLKVMSKSGGNLRALVGFNLPTMPQGCSVESATLRLYAGSARTGRTIQVYRLAGSWTEGGVTWANQPQTTGGAVTASSDIGYREWNVAGMVQAMYTGSNNGFLVRDAVENQDAEQQLSSREKGSNPPQLVIQLGTGAPPPPPGSGDTGAPDTTITGSPLDADPSSAATFTFAGVDDVTPAAGLTFECQLDVPETAPWTACSTPRAYSNLAVGSHIFRVRAKDAAGNVDPQPAVDTWTIDQTDPETVISRGPDASTTSTNATFEFLSPETGSTFQCSLDLASFAACTSPATYSGLAVGQHTFQVRAVDAAGNLDETPASYPWSIQVGGTPVNCGPSVTLSSVADSWIDQGGPSSNKGTDGILKVMSKSGSKALRALVRFDLPAMPSGCTIDTAQLRLYASSASSTQRTLQAFRVGGSWTETGVTWQNAPATAGSAVTTTSGSGYRVWGVQTLVQAMYSSGQNNGFLIKDSNEGQDAEQQFHAREKGESPPQLVLTFKPA